MGAASLECGRPLRAQPWPLSKPPARLRQPEGLRAEGNRSKLCVNPGAWLRAAEANSAHQSKVEMLGNAGEDAEQPPGSPDG